MSAYPAITMTTTGDSTPVAVSPPQNVLWKAPPAYALGLYCTVSPGATLNYSVQVTADPEPSANGNWNNHDNLQNLTASANGAIGFPVTGIRLVVNSLSNGSVNLGIAQWP